MAKGIIAALLAAGFAVLIAPYARAGLLGETYYNVTMAVPRSGFDPQAMANTYCDRKGWRHSPEQTVAMINPQTAFFSRIVCIAHKI